MGWLQEPAFTGAENSIQVYVSELSGAPIARTGVALSVQVMFGSALVTLPLIPVPQAGEFRAILSPTQPGRYTFRVSGTVRGRPLDVESTCSNQTFSCVSPASQVEFPAANQSNTQIVQGLVRALARAQRAADAADTARAIAIIALAVTVMMLVALVGIRVSDRRRSARP